MKTTVTRAEVEAHFAAKLAKVETQIRHLRSQLRRRRQERHALISVRRSFRRHMDSQS